ncbi:Bacterial Ig-like domain (group 2) [compost metagenome]
MAPSNAANKTVLWTSDNPASVTVNVYGAVTAAALGNAVITATTADGGKTAACAVSVVAAPNLLANPGFEAGDFIGWPTHFTQAAIVGSNAHTGDYAARLTTAYGGIEQYISGLAPNTTYTLRAWAKGTNGEFGVRNYGSYQRQVYVNAAEYTQGEITFTTGSTNTTVTVFMYKRAAAGEVYFDDFELLIKTPQ